MWGQTHVGNPCLPLNFVVNLKFLKEKKNPKKSSFRRDPISAPVSFCQW